MPTPKVVYYDVDMYEASGYVMAATSVYTDNIPMSKYIKEIKIYDGTGYVYDKDGTEIETVFEGRTHCPTQGVYFRGYNSKSQTNFTEQVAARVGITEWENGADVPYYIELIKRTYCTLETRLPTYTVSSSTLQKFDGPLKVRLLTLKEGNEYQEGIHIIVNNLEDGELDKEKDNKIFFMFDKPTYFYGFEVVSAQNPIFEALTLQETISEGTVQTQDLPLQETVKATDQAELALQETVKATQKAALLLKESIQKLSTAASTLKLQEEVESQKVELELKENIHIGSKGGAHLPLNETIDLCYKDLSLKQMIKAAASHVLNFEEHILEQLDDTNSLYLIENIGAEVLDTLDIEERIVTTASTNDLSFNEKVIAKGTFSVLVLEDISNLELLLKERVISESAPPISPVIGGANGLFIPYTTFVTVLGDPVLNEETGDLEVGASKIVKAYVSYESKEIFDFEGQRTVSNIKVYLPVEASLNAKCKIDLGEKTYNMKQLEIKKHLNGQIAYYLCYL